MKAYNRASLGFELKNKLAEQGQNSIVYQGYDPQLQTEFVYKKVFKSKLNADAYFDEASILYKSSHPYVVQVQYACEDDENIYIASPYYKKGSIAKKMESGFLTSGEIIRYSTHALSGLQNIHTKGLIHFDIKPDNLLLSDRDEALVSDFGLTKHMNKEGEARPDLFYGLQIPTEAFSGLSDFDQRYDIYLMGLTMYRMCVGNDEFYSQWDNLFKKGGEKLVAQEAIAKRFPRRSGKDYPLHIPKQLQSVVNKCLHPDREQRYSTCTQVVNSLAGVNIDLANWRFTIEGSNRVWSREINGVSSQVKVCLNTGKSEAFRNSTGSSQRRYTKGCCESLDDKEIVKLLKEI